MSDVARFRPTRRFRPAPVRPASRVLPTRWLPLMLGVAVVATMMGLPKQKAGAPQAAAHFQLCRDAAQADCVIDGDTFRYRGAKIRLADIDAPETQGARCAAERQRGERATQRLIELMNAGPMQMAREAERDEDVYGRKLRTLWRDGRSLGDILVAEGLARPWDGARRSWCG